MQVERGIYVIRNVTNLFAYVSGEWRIDKRPRDNCIFSASKRQNVKGKKSTLYLWVYPRLFRLETECGFTCFCFGYALNKYSACRSWKNVEWSSNSGGSPSYSFRTNIINSGNYSFFFFSVGSGSGRTRLKKTSFLYIIRELFWCFLKDIGVFFLLFFSEKFF